MSAPAGGQADSPLRILAGRAAQLQDDLRRLRGVGGHLARLRVAVFFGCWAVAWAASQATLTAGEGLRWRLGAGLLAAAFVALVILHRRIDGRAEAAAAQLAWNRRASARAALDWQALEASGSPLPPPVPRGWDDRRRRLAADLDLGGRRSLMALLGTAEVTLGWAQLWEVMVSPVGDAATGAATGLAADGLAERQEAVAELAAAMALRESLASAAADHAASRQPPLAPAALIAWGRRAPGFDPQRRWPALVACNLALAAAIAARIAGWSGGGAAIFAVVATQWALARCLAASTHQALADADQVATTLAQLRGGLQPLLGAEVGAAAWRRARTALTADGVSVSRLLARLGAWLRSVDALRNQLARPLGALVLWPQHAACAITAWRRRHGADLAAWVEALATLEAYVCLGGYAFEHPGGALLRRPASESPAFVAEGLGHPLLARPVANDLALGDGRWAYVVSGSNMSGKSTLLRAVGLAVLMGEMGLPVVATRLVSSPWALASSMRVTDSLAEGASHFWAELMGLKVVLEAALPGSPPALFLLDEILHGTNSRDRQVGAWAVLERLRQLRAFGLMTTHDLALTEGADSLGATNVHFADHVGGGGLAFDFHMRRGVVAASNALALMRAAGIEVGKTSPG